MKCAFLIPLLAATSITASAVLNRQSSSVTVADCVNSDVCKIAAKAWTDCAANARVYPSIGELPNAGLAECLCIDNHNTTWRTGVLDPHRIFRPDWENELLGCITCVAGATDCPADASITSEMRVLIDSNDPKAFGYCTYPDEFIFRQRSRQLKEKHSFPILLPMATLPVSPAMSPVTRDVVVVEKKAEPVWATFPASPAMRACSIDTNCQQAGAIFTECAELSNEDAIYDCLCTTNAAVWKKNLDACTPCIDKALLKVGAETTYGTLGPAITTGWVDTARQQYCITQRYLHGKNELLVNLGEQLTSVYQSPILIWNMTLLECPIFPPAGPVNLTDPRVHGGRDVDSTAVTLNTGLLAKVVGPKWVALSPSKKPAVEARQKPPVNSWVGPIIPAVQTCLDSHACARSAAIFDWCMACIPGHELQYTNWNCLCSPDPTSFRKEWWGASTQEDGLAMACVDCLAAAVPGAQDATIDLSAALSTYCYNPEGQEDPVPGVRPYIAGRNQLLGWASNSTFTYRIPVTLLNNTVAVKTPWMIPSGFVDWQEQEPW